VSQLRTFDAAGDEFDQNIQGGVLADGLNSFFGALATMMPVTTFAQVRGTDDAMGAHSLKLDGLQGMVTLLQRLEGQSFGGCLFWCYVDMAKIQAEAKVSGCGVECFVIWVRQRLEETKGVCRQSIVHHSFLVLDIEGKTWNFG
jgi:hypothetical protein